MGVRFTPGEELASPTTGTVLGTPHTKSGKKLTYERMEDSSNSSPGLRKARVGRVISLGIFPKWFSILSLLKHYNVKKSKFSLDGFFYLFVTSSVIF